MALVMTPIFTRTLASSGTVTNVVFNNIPQNYTDLLMQLSLKTTPTAYNEDLVSMGLNNDTSSLYSQTAIQGDGYSAASFRGSGTSAGILLAPTSATAIGGAVFGSASVYIPNYTSSNFKSIISDTVTEANGQGALIRLWAALYRSTSPITSINIASGFYAANSTFSLYGIIRSGA